MRHNHFADVDIATLRHAGQHKLADEAFARREAWIREYLSDTGAAAYAVGKFLQATVGGDPEAARWLREKDIPVMKAQATSPNTSGGVLIPEEISPVILSLLEAYGVARRNAMIWPMTADTKYVPRNTTGFTVNWINENSQANSFAQAGFDNINLTVKKLGCFVKVSDELMEDAEGLGEFFVTGLAEAFAKTEDGVMFGGDGTSTYAGGVGIGVRLADGNHTAGKIVAASGHTGFTTIDATDIGNTIAALPARAMRNAKIYISVGGYGAALVRLAAVSGGLVANIGPDGTLRANWHGLPVEFTSSLPTSTSSLASQLLMVIGDLRQAVAFGMRRDLTIQRFTETFAETGQVLIRATERIDIVSHDLGNNTTAGAAVGLYAAAG